jgi:hypothetical protein
MFASSDIVTFKSSQYCQSSHKFVYYFIDCNNLDLDRKLSPFQMKTNGITDINALKPPSKLHAPEIPK